MEYRQKWNLKLSILKNGANPNAQDFDGNTSLHLAAGANDLVILKSLVENPYNENKGNIKAVNEYGWSVLHSAASGIINNNLEDWKVVEWLLERLIKEEVDLSLIKDQDGYSVEDVFLQKDWSYLKHYQELLKKVLVTCNIKVT